jgi:hypothetical protein
LAHDFANSHAYLRRNDRGRLEGHLVVCRPSSALHPLESRMPQARVFVPQDAVESWLTEGRADLTRDTLTFEGVPVRVSGAVRFLAEVAGGGDEPRLVGRVKTRDQLLSLSAEHSGESVLLGDNAYQVTEGYLLAPEGADGPDLVSRIHRLFSRP